MFHTIKDFIADWQFESETTLKVLNALTNESLDEPKGIDYRSVGTLANHIVSTLVEMPHALGLITDGKIEKCKSVKELTEAYKKYSEALVESIKTNWTDATLQEEKNMYGENWKNGFSLQVLIVHQIHHRGQLTVLMRLAGLKVPGVYGPAKEEWTAYGMQAPVE